jgi:hypothetical protein
MQKLVAISLVFFCTSAYAFWFENEQADKQINLERTRGAYAWKIKKDHWDAKDEEGYGKFVATLGEAVAKKRCRNVTACMLSDANPYHHTDPKDLVIKADCADWTYLVRAYYAWKNHLPFALAAVEPHPANPKNSSDMRYSTQGNVVVERVDLTSSFWGFPDAKQVFTEILPRMISTANIRTNQPQVRNGLWSDFYPVDISRESIRPGSVIYDPFGHVVVVYKITDNGQIYYVDAHTDNNLTIGVFNEKFSRTAPLIGGGFKNWRPIRLVNYTRDSNGYLMGGKIVAEDNNRIRDYSEVQYYGSTRITGKVWDRATFQVNGKTVSFFEYVQAKMSNGAMRIDPIQEMGARLTELCETMQARSRSVETARKNNIHLAKHPTTLPYNIYVTEGDWETYASPSRDTVLRILFSSLLSKSKDWVSLWRKNHPSIQFHGSDLPAALLREYRDRSESCYITYYNSLGGRVRLNLEDVRARLPAISFDAYHCPELRWGAALNSAEGRSCHSTAEKNYWYSQQQLLRNQLERRFDVRMNYRADELSTPRLGVGVTSVPETDIPGYLSTL